MEEMFMNIAGSHLADMRLLIEGAVDLYEDDAMPLNRLAIQNNMLTASNAFDTIGTALYGLRQHIRAFQEAYAKEGIRQAQA